MIDWPNIRTIQSTQSHNKLDECISIWLTAFICLASIQVFKFSLLEQLLEYFLIPMTIVVQCHSVMLNRFIGFIVKNNTLYLEILVLFSIVA